MNIRHEIDPDLVRKQVEKAVAENEIRRVTIKQEETRTLESYKEAQANGTAHLWSKAPSGPGYVDSMIDEWNNQQLEYYSKVRVIELENPIPTHDGKWNKFILVYGEADDMTVSSGTGPFDTLDAAKNWFLNSGR